jgi:hypothetical protein
MRKLRDEIPDGLFLGSRSLIPDVEREGSIRILPPDRNLFLGDCDPNSAARFGHSTNFIQVTLFTVGALAFASTRASSVAITDRDAPDAASSWTLIYARSKILKAWQVSSAVSRISPSPSGAVRFSERGCTFLTVGPGQILSNGSRLQRRSRRPHQN